MPVLFIGLFIVSYLSVLVLIFVFPAVSIIKALFYFHSYFLLYLINLTFFNN